MLSKTRALEQKVQGLKEVDQAGALTKQMKKQLRKMHCALRIRKFFDTFSPLLLHAAAGLLFILMYTHLQHLYRVQAIRQMAEEVRVSILEVESGQRGFLLTGNDLYLDNYRYHRRILRYRVELLCRLIPNTDANKFLCGELGDLIDKKLTEMEDTIRLARGGHIKESLDIVRTDKGMHYMHDIEDRLGRIHTDSGTPGVTVCLVN